MQQSQAIQFRQKEISRLFALAQAGESANIVGISGVGKSNLFHHLLDFDTQTQYLGDAVGRHLFVRVNFHYAPDFSHRSLYSLILEQLEHLDDSHLQRLGITHEQIRQIRDDHDALLDAGDDVVKVQRYFKRALHTLLSRSIHRLVFVFDQFGMVYREVDPRWFANLRGLRETYKYRICYFVFTRGTLATLAGEDHSRSEFYELFAANELGLKPYNHADSVTMLHRIAQRHRLELDATQIEHLYKLSGGHAGLLRAMFLAWHGRENVGSLVGDHPQRTVQISEVSQWLRIPNVLEECRKIWHSLNVDEQRTLKRKAAGFTTVSSNIPHLDELKLKGVLVNHAPQSVFSPLFATFVTQQEALWKRPLFLDEQGRHVLVYGKRTKPLTAQEFRIFELLYNHQNQVISKDEIVEVGWPEARGNVSDAAIAAAISRLRRKLNPESNKAVQLEAVREQGYRLTTKSIATPL